MIAPPVNASTASLTPRRNRRTGYWTLGLGRGTPGTTSNGRVYLPRQCHSSNDAKYVLEGDGGVGGGATPPP